MRTAGNQCWMRSGPSGKSWDALLFSAWDPARDRARGSRFRSLCPNKVVAQNSSFLFVTYGSSDTLSTPHILIRDFKNQHSAGRRDNNLGRSTTTGSGDCERLRLRELREQSHHPPSTKNIIIEAVWRDQKTVSLLVSNGSGADRRAWVALIEGTRLRNKGDCGFLSAERSIVFSPHLSLSCVHR